MLKRVFDVTFALFCLTVFAPLAAVIAVFDDAWMFLKGVQLLLQKGHIKGRI